MTDRRRRPGGPGRRLWRSFRAAARGLWTVVWSEANMSIHLAAALVVLMWARWLGWPAWRFALLLALIGLVTAAEALNAAVERFVDYVHPGAGEAGRQVKDAAAGGVLAAATAAGAAGIILFGSEGPALWHSLTAAWTQAPWEVGAVAVATAALLFRGLLRR